MELSKRQAQFYTVILLVAIIIAVTIMAVDFGIKGAILEESNALRKVINGQRAAQNGATNYPADDVAFPRDVLGDDASRMEARGSSNGAKESSPKKEGRANPSSES